MTSREADVVQAMRNEKFYILIDGCVASRSSKFFSGPFFRNFLLKN
jgi:hypothetical protein